MPPLIPYGEKKVANNMVEQQLLARDKALVALKEHLVAQNQMKKFHDLKQREVEFEVGDVVFLKLRPYHQPLLAKNRCEKLLWLLSGAGKNRQCSLSSSTTT